MRHLFAVLIFVIAAVCASSTHAGTGDFVFVRVGKDPIRLPRCPKGCEIGQFRRLATFLADKPARDELAKQKDPWRMLFSNSGIAFSKGGFVIYDPTTAVCTVAATSDELDIIASWYYGCR